MPGSWLGARREGDRRGLVTAASVGGAVPTADDGAGGRRGWGVVLSAIAALPSVVAAIAQIRAGWNPIADEGVIAIRAHDVLTARTPLLGQLSLASEAAGGSTRGLGPSGYWLFALPARAGPLWAPAALAGAVSAAASIATVRLAGRRGGLGLMVAVTAAIVLAARAVGTIHLASVWNPSVGLVPMALLVLLGWSVALGERQLYPWTIAVATLAMHAHLAYVLPAAGVVGVAGVLGWGPEVVARWSRRRSARHHDPPAVPDLQAALGAVAVGLVLWAPTIVEQLGGKRGNLNLVSRSSQAPGLGYEAAGRLLAWSVGIPPAFTRDRPRGFAALRVFAPPSALAAVSATLLGLALVALVVLGARHRRRDLVAPGAVLLAVAGGAASTMARTPDTELKLSLVYTSLWLVPVGAVAWCVALSVGATLLPASVAAGARARAPDRRVTRAAVAVVALALTAVAVSTPVVDSEAPLYPVAEELGDEVVARVERGGRYLVEETGPLGLQVGPALAYRIRRDGGKPLIRGFDGEAAGTAYVPDGKRCDAVIGVVREEGGAGDPEVSDGAEVLVVVDVPRTGATGPPGRAALTWSADTGPPSC